MGIVIKNCLKLFTQRIIFPLIYFLNRWKKVDDKLVVFADAHHDSCPKHMLRLKDKLRYKDFTIEEFYVDVAKLGYLKGMMKMAHFMRIYPRCAYVIICDNFLPVASCQKKKKTKVIQLWHGCGAFKKFGYDALDDAKGYKANVYRNYDLVTVSGEYPVKFFSSAMRQNDGVVKALGISHTDKFFDDEFIKTAKDKFRYEYPDAAGKKVLLWAPTFRGNAGKPLCVGEDIIDEVSNELPEDVILIKSLHPHFRRKQVLSTDELMVNADVLITDYSSVFYDFLLLDKPIIFFAPDYDTYMNDRGFYLEYKTLPGEIVTSSEKKMLIDTIKSAINNKVDLKRERRMEFKSKYMSGCDGHSTERIISAITTMEEKRL